MSNPCTGKRKRNEELKNIRVTENENILWLLLRARSLKMNRDDAASLRFTATPVDMQLVDKDSEYFDVNLDGVTMRVRVPLSDGYIYRKAELKVKHKKQALLTEETDNESSSESESV
jgi:hypothetical protein